MPNTDSQNAALGYTAAIAVTLIWATWLVASRAGAQSPLTPYDLAALRYGVSSIVALPIVLYFKPWQSMTLKRIALVSFMLGPVYILCVFLAFDYAPAAHGGIFMNGALPALTLVISWILFKQRASKVQVLGVLMIIVGAILAAADAAELSLVDGLTQVLFCSSIVNAVLYVPIWYWFLPSGISEATQSQFLLQTLYQGLIPGLVGLLLVATATRNIGPSATAAFMAAVPTLGSILGMVFLNEMLGSLGWLSLAILTPGILLTVFNSKS